MDYAHQAENAMLMEEPYNAGDKKQVTAARKREARERREELDYVRHIMSTPQGRKWMCKLIAKGDPLVSPYSPANTPEHTHINIGTQRIPAQLMLDIREAAPDQYVQMLIEAMNDRIVKYKTKASAEETTE